MLPASIGEGFWGAVKKADAPIHGRQLCPDPSRQRSSLPPVGPDRTRTQQFGGFGREPKSQKIRAGRQAGTLQDRRAANPGPIHESSLGIGTAPGDHHLGLTNKERATERNGAARSNLPLNEGDSKAEGEGEAAPRRRIDAVAVGRDVEMFEEE